MIVSRITSGVFFAPATGNQIFLRLMIDSHAPAATTAAFRVNRIDADGAREVFREAELPVPSGGGVSLDISEVAGLSLEVELDLPDHRLLPSLEIIQRFVADGATITELRLAPTAFMQQQLRSGIIMGGVGR